MASGFKPTFGATAATTTASGGLFGSAQPTGFGSAVPSFGTTTTTASTGFGFGAAATSGFGSTGFGNPAATSASGFGGFNFGSSTAAAPGFGTTTTTTASSNFGFGLTATTRSTPAFGFGGFGSITTPASTTTATTGFGGLSGFGTSAGTGTGFGTGTTTGFGTTFGSTGGFGAGGASTGFNFQTAAAACPGQTQQPAVLQTANVYSALSMPLLFGDERDAIIAKWNQLQAFWGTGRGYFNQQGHSVEFTPDNPFSFFKAVGYNCLPKVRNEDGLVALTFDRKMAEICEKQQSIVDELQRIVVGHQPNANVCVDGIRPLIDDKTEMVIYVQQRANTGVMSRVTAADLFAHLNNLKSQLIPVAISAVIPKTGMTSEQKKLYLDNAPAGIDARIWEQAKLDNPDPENMIPVPMVGFTELYSRLKHQEQQTSLHQARLDLLAADIATLQHNQTDVVAKTEQYKRNQVMLSHRILKILVKQEMYRKHGYSIQADDEQLRAKLETIYAELNAPMQFKGRLNELMSQMRLQKQIGVASRAEVNYQMDPAVQQELKQYLKRQQEGINHLINIIKDDLEELQVVEHGLADSSKHKR